MKIIFAVVAISIIIIGYIPYLKDIFARKTAPHIYTWLIWLITQSTAIAALIYGGGKMGGAGLVAGVILVFVIFLLAFKYGTKNITASDTILLAFSILAIAVWWQLDSPLLSVVIISLIDGIAYLPTFRKTYVEPHSETASFWALMALSNVFGILASAEYNLLTMTYLSTLALANIFLFFLIVVRRRTVEREGK